MTVLLYQGCTVQSISPDTLHVLVYCNIFYAFNNNGAVEIKLSASPAPALCPPLFQPSADNLCVKAASSSARHTGAYAWHIKSLHKSPTQPNYSLMV